MELRCDDQERPGCWSGLNNGPMGKAAHAQVARVARRLEREAAKQGWTTADGRWRCPVCSQAPDPRP